MLGDFHFEDMAAEGLKGSLFLALYLLVSLVLLLNLLIAVLSSTFSQLESHGVGLYLQSLINEYPRYAYHPSLNFFTFHAPPFFALSLFCFPCAKRYPSCCGFALEIIYYFPLFLIVLAGVVTLDVIVFPFTYYSLMKTHCQRKNSCLFFVTLFFFPLCFPLIILLDLVVASV